MPVALVYLCLTYGEGGRYMYRYIVFLFDTATASLIFA